MNREEALAQALADALEGMRDMIGYIPDYFRDKWGHDEYIARASAVLEQQSYQPVSYDSPECESPVEPTIGRIVHYVSYGTPGGEYESECRAALITAVTSDRYLDIAVLNPTGLFFNLNVEFSEEHTGGTWHWPERV